MKYNFVIDELDLENGFGKVLSQVKPKTTVLELGCATGYMTRYMKEKLGCEVYIVEIEQEAFDIAKQYAVDGICADLTQDAWCQKFMGMKFDNILLCDVLEHVNDPKGLLQKTVPLLQEDGQILISLPNVTHNDILMRMYEGHWDYQDKGLLDNTHIRFWGIENVTQLFDDGLLGIEVFDATLLPTGRTEQYWDNECHVDPQFLASLRKRFNGEIYQFILTVRHATYLEKNCIKTLWLVPGGNSHPDLPLISEASDILDLQAREQEKNAALLKNLIADNESLNDTIREIRAYHEDLLVEQAKKDELLKALSADNDALNEKMRETRAYHEELLEEHSKKDELLKALSADNDALNEKMRETRAYHEELLAEQTKKDELLKVLSADNDALNEKMRETRAYHEELLAEQTKKDELLKVLSADNDALNEKLRETRAYHEELLESMQQISEKNNTLVESSNSLTLRNEELTNKIQEKNAMLEQRTAEQERTEAILRELAADKCAANDALRELTDQNGILIQELKGVVSENNQLVSKSSEMERSISELKAGNQVLTNENYALTQSVHQLTEQSSFLLQSIQNEKESNRLLQEKNEQIARELSYLSKDMEQQISMLEAEKSQLSTHAGVLNAQLDATRQQMHAQAALLESVQNERNAALDRCSAIAEERNRFEQELNVANSYVQAINVSRAHRMAEKYYGVKDKVFPVGSRRRHVIGRIVRGTANFLHPQKPEPEPMRPKSQIDMLHDMGKYERMDVITTQHCMFIARLVKCALERVDIQCEIHVGEPESYQNIPYLIIAPQFVKRFPPVYFVFQVEQTISSRWFTPEYFVSLQNSCVILDYALQNVEFFHRPENEDVRSRVYYVPLDYYPNYLSTPAPEEKEYDVLFYGSIAGERRGAILDAVGKKYNLKIVSELFGEDLYREIRKAKVILNIHYYEGALIETTRLFEALSLNSSVIVSEDSFDKHESKRLKDFVDFVPVDDTEKLLARIGYWLSHDEERKEKVKANQKALEQRKSAFDYFFYRFLLAHDRISFDTFYHLAGNFFSLNGNRICLSLPESTQRRQSFDNDNQYGFQCIPGLRHEKGWVGAGMSYKLIFTKALETNLKNIMICEDDVIFPHDFSRRLQQITEYLEGKKKWSVFSGVMADIGNVKVLEAQKMGKREYIQIDHMISMVFNIYNRQMFALLARWDESNRNVETNAIDRYLEKKKLSVYTQIPFLVGHKEELRSTIWGFSNSQYADMIANSEKKLKKLAEEYEQKSAAK